MEFEYDIIDNESMPATLTESDCEYLGVEYQDNKSIISGKKYKYTPKKDKKDEPLGTTPQKVGYRSNEKVKSYSDRRQVESRNAKISFMAYLVLLLIGLGFSIRLVALGPGVKKVSTPMVTKEYQYPCNILNAYEGYFRQSDSKNIKLNVLVGSVYAPLEVNSKNITLVKSNSKTPSIKVSAEISYNLNANDNTKLLRFTNDAKLTKLLNQGGDRELLDNLLLVAKNYHSFSPDHNYGVKFKIVLQVTPGIADLINK